MSDHETPGQDDEFDGWRARWTSRRRPYFAVQHGATPAEWDRGLVALHEPVLILTKPGRRFVEVKGQADIDRPVMLAHGMVSASLCDAHFARQWGDEAAAVAYEIEAERWRRIVDVRTVAAAVQRVGGKAARMLVEPAGAGARGTR